MIPQTLLWALAAVGAFAIVVHLYRWPSSGFADIAPDRMSAEPNGERGPADIVAAHLHAPLVGGNRIELLLNGVQIFPAMLEAIDAATDSINLLTYIYWRGAVGGRFADALARAAERGVEVRVVLDAVGALKMDPALVERMEAAGCRVAWFNPVRWNALTRFNHRTHRKVLVVDGRVGFTGGVGIADEWDGDADAPEHWRDDHFRIEGPAVRHLQGSFAENWRQATGEVLTGERMFPRLADAGEVPMIVINSGPVGATSEIGLTCWLMFRNARQRINVATPYFVPDPDLELGLADAARRGIDVRLLVPNDHQDSRLVRYASQTWYRDLLEAGVRLYEYQPTLMHVKSVTVDGEWGIIGSPNFDTRSFEINFEVAVAVFDRDFTAELDRSFEQDLERARELSLDEVKRWSALRRARNWGARLFREQL